MEDKNSEFHTLDNEPTQELEPDVLSPPEKEKDEIIPLYKRHIFTLIVAAVIIFIFGGVLGYSFGKKMGKQELLDEKFDAIAKVEDHDTPKKLNPEEPDPAVPPKKEVKENPIKIEESPKTEESKKEIPKPAPPPPKKVPESKPEVKPTPKPSSEEPPESPFIESSVKKEPVTETVVSDEKKDKYLQIASFKTEKQALDAQAKYEADGFSPFEIKKADLKDKGVWFRLMLGPVSLTQAKTLKQEFKTKYKLDTLIR